MNILKAAGVLLFVIVAGALFLPVIGGMSFTGINDAGVAAILDLRTFWAFLALVIIAALAVGALVKGKGGDA